MRLIVKIIVLASLVTPLMLAPLALAHGGENHGTAREAEVHEAELYGDKAKNRLSDANKKVCENRKKNIETIMKRSVARAENHAKLFTNVADKVKSFYEKQGKTFESYNELVKAVDDTKAAADAATAALKETGVFDCDSDDPKGDAKAFQETHHEAMQAIKDYRTAVKGLIKGVRSAHKSGSEQ